MNINNIKRIIQYAFLTFERNKLLSISTILIIFLISIFYNLLRFTDIITNHVIDNTTSKIDMNIEINQNIDINSKEVQDLITNLKHINDVQILLISQEEALQDFEYTQPELANFLKIYGQNPLPASIYISTNNLNAYKDITNILEEKDLEKIINYNIDEHGFVSQKERIYRYIEIAKFIINFSIIITILFLLIAIIIIYNTINIIIKNKKDEINIMKVIGAPSFYIVGPFIIEGFLYGIIGAITGLIFFYLILYFINLNLSIFESIPMIQTTLAQLSIIYNHSFLSYLIYDIILFGILGIFSSIMSIYHHIQFPFIKNKR